MFGVEELIWSAAKRLAVLVAGSLALVAVAFSLDRHVRPFAGASAGLALACVAMSLVALAQARRLQRVETLPEPLAPSSIYRTNASAPQEVDLTRATRSAAIAFVLLSLAGAMTIVAAAAR